MVFNYNIRFPGQYLDSESGMHYNYFRDYDPNVGRYMQSDPIGLKGGLNTFGYVGGKPLSFADPTGLECLSVGGRMTCVIPGGPGFTLPSPNGQPRTLGSNDRFYHETNVSRALDGANPDCVMQEITNSPTPGKPNAASSDGTLNNAQVTKFGDNFVRSYLTSTHATAMSIVVNTAGIGDGSTFGPGYVARYVQNGRAYTKGEGASGWQSIGSLSDWANERLWGKDLERIIQKCKCQ